MRACDQPREALTAEVLAGRQNLVVDLSRVTFMDSSCLHVLLQVCRMADEDGRTLNLAAPQRVVARMMALSGVDQMIAVHASVAEAAGQRSGLPAP